MGPASALPAAPPLPSEEARGSVLHRPPPKTLSISLVGPLRMEPGPPYVHGPGAGATLDSPLPEKREQGPVAHPAGDHDDHLLASLRPQELRMSSSCHGFGPTPSP
jgi:hypothetical protein